MRTKQLAAIVLALAALLSGRVASAADLRGPIASTVTLTEDSQLVADVTCTVVGAPCIAFGASGISLRLNGFSISGLADPVTGCGGSNNTTVESGLDISNQRGIVIQGPGVVERFRSSGIRINVSERVMVSLVTSSTNCMAGIFIIGGSNHEILGNTLTRNGNATLPCGGI
jgi:hypothetical protein